MHKIKIIEKIVNETPNDFILGTKIRKFDLEICKRYPNDMILGREVRNLINSK